MISVFIINGPNLASLGKREPDIYGDVSSDQLNSQLSEMAGKQNFQYTFYQNDFEGSLVQAIQEASSTHDALVINPGAYSHTSIAVLDAMRSFKGPVVEVHVSQIHKREPYRHRMLTAQGADAVIAGAGIYGYLLAFNLVLDLLRR